jgi:hypothetical protein
VRIGALRSEDPGLKPHSEGLIVRRAKALRLIPRTKLIAFSALLSQCALPQRQEQRFSGDLESMRLVRGLGVEGDVVGPAALGDGVVGGADAGERSEVVGEVGLVVVAAGEG